MTERPRHVIRYGGREFHNDYVFPAEIAALRAHKTGKFQEEVILEWVKARNLKGTYIDCGAHIGNHTLFFAVFCPSTEVIAIEGEPTIYGLLEKNIKRNLSVTEQEKVGMFNLAAWSKTNEKVQFAQIPRNNAGHSHIINTGGRTGEAPATLAKTIALDEITLADKLVVLKIDVEDTEEEVIAGAMKTIGKHKPIIIIERHNQAQLKATMDQLKPFSYEAKVNWSGVHTYALMPAC